MTSVVLIQERLLPIFMSHKTVVRVKLLRNLGLTETASNVVFSEFMAGVGKDLISLTYLDQFTQVKTGGSLTYSCCLLHGVSNDCDGIILTQLDPSLHPKGPP